MEYEVRFYYGSEELEKILENLRRESDLKEQPRTYEKTTQYKLSWKRRLKSTTETEVNKEEEKEVRINPNDIDNFLFIISNVMNFKTVESYERYRTVFENDDVEISVDEYPFGVCMEIESKTTTKNPEDVVKDWVSRIGLDINNAYRLSWDDKYLELCEEQGVERFDEVTFDKPMPSVKKLSYLQ